MYELLSVLKENLVDIEVYIEVLNEFEIFQCYLKIFKDYEVIEMICDMICLMIMNFDNVYQVEELFEKYLESLFEECFYGLYVLQSMVDVLLVFGIVVVVFGVIKIMVFIDKLLEVLGGMIGGVLVGIFFGVFLVYGVVGLFVVKVSYI